MSEYKYNEPETMRMLQEYIDSTYDQHYSSGEKNKIQLCEYMDSQGILEGFATGSVLKYTVRYGKKNGYNKKDLLKALHYIIILMHTTDNEPKQDTP